MCIFIELDQLIDDLGRGLAVSDTPEELKRAAYMDANGLAHCEHCHRDVPAEETTDDLDECICNECLPIVERTCKLCGQVSGNWYGTDTPAGFVCCDCQDGRR